MPRRENVDEEDMLARCPRCLGKGEVFDIATATHTACPLCLGAGRVNRETLRAYHAGRPATES